MKNNIKVSIIVPIYNVEKYIGECVESIIDQTYKSIEIILVDDGSKDNSGKICDIYAKKDERIKVLHTKNLGVSTARNNGIKLASGKYIAFIDSDDIIHKKYIEVLLKDTNENILTVCNMQDFKYVIKEKENEKNNKYSICQLKKENFIDLYKMHLLNTPCCKLFNLDIIRKNNILFKQDLSLGEDLLFNLEYIKHIKTISIIDLQLYYYRQEENNTLSSKYTLDFNKISILLFDKFEKTFTKTAKPDELYKCLYNFLYLAFEHEFRNKSISIFNRIKNAHKVLSDVEIKKRLKKCNKYISRINSFLLLHNLVFTFKVLAKLKIINNKMYYFE